MSPERRVNSAPYSRRVLFVARGIEDGHFWVVQELDGTFVETLWRVEHEVGGYRLSHADDSRETARGYALGAFVTPESAVEALQTMI